MSAKVLNNFLEKEDFLKIKNTMLEPTFPWYYNERILKNTEKEIGNFQFTHIFYKDHMFQSDFCKMLIPILNKINLISIIKIKGNLGTLNTKSYVGGWHTDTNFLCKTAVFYVNSNNGGTMFEDGTVINSTENTLVVFDSNMSHTGFSQTDKNVRCVINLNYIENKEADYVI